MKNTTLSMLALAVAAAFAQPAFAQPESDSLESFRLPPSNERRPEAQGPVAEGVPAPQAPQPAPSRPAATPPVVAAPPVQEPAPAPRTETPPAPREAPRTTPTAPTASTPSAPTPDASAPFESAAPAAGEAAPAPTDTPPSPLPGVLSERTSPARAPAEVAASADRGASLGESPVFRWGLLAGLLAIVALAIALAWHRFVRSEAGAVSVPVIERPRPRVRPEPAETTPAPALAELAEDEDVEDEDTALPLRCAFEVTRLSVTLMTATLSYRITLTNMSDRLIRDIMVGGDMVSAHSSLSMNQQMAQAGEALEIRHKVPAMLPGQSIFLSGDLMLPIRAIRVVRRGEAALFVPLARLKIEAEGLEMALLRTSLVGQRPAGPGAGLRPFRLDLGPRIYSEIGQRTLAVPA